MHRNPFFEMEKADKFHKVDSDREYLTVEELKQMADVYTGSPQTKQTFMFCCFTGLRHSDMAALTWGNIEKTDLGDVVHVPSMQKTKHPVIVPLGIKAKEWMPERGDAKPSDLVFPNAPSLSTANRALKHMAKRAGINKVIFFHCSRHTFATMTLTAGSDLLTTSKLLGHKNVQTTTIYADVVMESKVGAVNQTNGFVQAISVVSGVEFSKVKVMSDVMMILSSGITCLIFVHGLGSVGIGTVLSAIFIGTTMSIIIKIVYKITGIEINLKPGYEENK